MNTEIKHEETVIKVLEALETIRPFLNKDGGDIELVDVKAETVFVKLIGNCNGCPMSFSTMKFRRCKYHQTTCSRNFWKW
jgi:Thioredoxin-like proteins and domains